MNRYVAVLWLSGVALGFVLGFLCGRLTTPGNIIVY